MVARLIIGALGGGRQGMKCSLPGVDALTADDQDASLFSFCSDWTSLARLAASGQGSVAGNSLSNQSAAVGHSVGSIPFFEVRTQEGTTNRIHNEWQANNYRGASGNETQNRISAQLDTSSATIILYPIVKIAFSGSTPFRQPIGPGTCFFVWFAYRDPRI